MSPRTANIEIQNIATGLRRKFAGWRSRDRRTEDGVFTTEMAVFVGMFVDSWFLRMLALDVKKDVHVWKLRKYGGNRNYIVSHFYC
jgi:hypothetical protein